MVKVWSSYNDAIQRAETLNTVVHETGTIPHELKQAILSELKVAYKSCVAEFFNRLHPDAMRELYRDETNETTEG